MASMYLFLTKISGYPIPGNWMESVISAQARDVKLCLLKCSFQIKKIRNHSPYKIVYLIVTCDTMYSCTSVLRSDLKSLNLMYIVKFKCTLHSIQILVKFQTKVIYFTACCAFTCITQVIIYVDSWGKAY